MDGHNVWEFHFEGKRMRRRINHQFDPKAPKPVLMLRPGLHCININFVRLDAELFNCPAQEIVQVESIQQLPGHAFGRGRLHWLCVPYRFFEAPQRFVTFVIREDHELVRATVSRPILKRPEHREAVLIDPACATAQIRKDSNPHAFCTSRSSGEGPTWKCPAVPRRCGI